MRDTPTHHTRAPGGCQQGPLGAQRLLWPQGKVLKRISSSRSAVINHHSLLHMHLAGGLRGVRPCAGAVMAGPKMNSGGVQHTAAATTLACSFPRGREDQV